MNGGDVSGSGVGDFEHGVGTNANRSGRFWAGAERAKNERERMNRRGSGSGMNAKVHKGVGPVEDKGETEDELVQWE